MLSKRLKDYIGIPIILAALLFAATSAMSMDTPQMMLMFNAAKLKIDRMLLDADGNQIVDTDGNRIVG